jgi:hypothetical protein
MEKLEQVKKFSNPQEVFNKGRQYGLTVYLSPKNSKKYAIVDPNNKVVSFGQMGMEDATFHKDPIRIDKFKKRNAKWANAPKYTPAWLSYYLLW